MMMLLELEHVCKSYSRGSRVALHDVSLMIDWGERRSGRSTLLRIAAGIEAADTGVVRFTGRNLAERGGGMLGDGISYCRTAFRSSAGHNIFDQLVAGQFGRGISRPRTRSRAWEALGRVAAERCATQRPEELNGEETIRVAIARALTSEPQLLVIDEPTIGVDHLARDGILDLLRLIADEGVAILTSTGDGTGLLGADRVLSLSKGKLRGETIPELAPVSDISHRRKAAG
jgi:putative ABC transport system ATP-binding protein